MTSNLGTGALAGFEGEPESEGECPPRRACMEEGTVALVFYPGQGTPGGGGRGTGGLWTVLGPGSCGSRDPIGGIGADRGG